MNKLKAKWYYLARFLGWYFWFSFVSGIVKLIGVEIPILLNLIIIIIDFIIFHISLNKTFFKPYNYITIRPKFPKLTIRFSIKVYLMTIALIFAIFALFLGGFLLLVALLEPFSKISDDFIFKCVIFIGCGLMLPLCYISTLFVINRTVKENAIIELKYKNNLTSN